MAEGPAIPENIDAETESDVAKIMEMVTDINNSLILKEIIIKH